MTSNKRESILKELRYELTTPRHPDLLHDEAFWMELRHKIGSLLCQAEECGKQDYEYIISNINITKQQAREIIKGKRTYDHIEKNVSPLIKRWVKTIDDLKVESHRLEDAGIEDPSEVWEELADEMCRLAHEIDSKTTAIRMGDKNAFPSYVKRTEELIQGSIQLACPDQKIGKISIKNLGRKRW